jgi:hypothetical protein
VWGPKSSAPVVFLRDFEMMLTSSAKNKKWKLPWMLHWEMGFNEANIPSLLCAEFIEQKPRFNYVCEYTGEW